MIIIAEKETYDDEGFGEKIKSGTLLSYIYHHGHMAFDLKWSNYKGIY